MKNYQFNNNLIGIIILTYNSINTINKAILSAKKITQNIVIVDSGSTDGTIELAQRSACEVHFRKWSNSFAEQRNHGLKLISTEWVIMLDSDEYISMFDSEVFLNYHNNTKIGGINFIIKNILDSGQSSTLHRYTRMFRKNNAFKYQGAIHEQIRESIENQNYVVIDSEFEITHSGYSEINEEKLERNLKMLRNELDLNPEDDYIKYHLASTYFAHNDIEKSQILFLELISSKQLTNEQIDNSYIKLAQIYLRKDNYAKVAEFLERVPNEINLRGLRNFILSSVLLIQKDYRVALSLMTNKDTLSSTLVNQDIVQQAIQRLEKLNMQQKSSN
ncbi:MAG TPA: glycosyltransferase [Candidatus Kapabacteria bacterium]|nr:glycosyltransferase [Candidatus Kapabacteria bacterium]